MTSKILNKGGGYFSTFNKLSDVKINNKIYYALFISLSIGIVYYVITSLINRVSHKTNLSQKQKEVDAAGKAVLNAQPLDQPKNASSTTTPSLVSTIPAQELIQHVVSHHQLVIPAKTRWTIAEFGEHMNFAHYQTVLNSQMPHKVFEVLVDDLLLLCGKKCTKMSSSGKIQIFLDPDSRRLALESDQDIFLNFGHENIVIEPSVFFKRMKDQNQRTFDLVEEQEMHFYLSTQEALYLMSRLTNEEIYKFLSKKLPPDYSLRVFTQGKMNIGVGHIIETGESVLCFKSTKRLQFDLYSAQTS